ncbi:hypothetical protein [Achromobacter mucicolens]|uniref:hypothetical protein n=1 Tax=Achromobacter mucicolens TaxID=1389922 RepID=UPI0028B0076B|nr:hypothetical protein [Achromobacter mucicolens]
MDLWQQLEKVDADRADGLITDQQYVERRTWVLMHFIDFDELLTQAKERALLRGM